MSKKFRKNKSASVNGEIHFIHEETYSCKWVVGKEACNEIEARRITKHEALKLIFLVRE
jgi:hypothetical protein